MEPLTEPLVEIIADSIGPCKKRLTTLSVKLHRYMLAEWNTHRDFSRNAASSRAIPAKKLRERVEAESAFPYWWGKEQPGMSPGTELEGSQLDLAKQWWESCVAQALVKHHEGELLGICKQIVNRVIEPYMFTYVLVTATEWENFYWQRCDGEAQAEIRLPAEAIQAALRQSEPEVLQANQWHLPYIAPSDRLAVSAEHNDPRQETQELICISMARCARVSHLNNGMLSTRKKDVELAKKLVHGKPPRHVPHLSPAEHVAMALPDGAQPQRYGNFVGWKQYRKMFSNEYAGRENRG